MKSNKEYKGSMKIEYDGRKKKYSCTPILNIQVLFNKEANLDVVKKQFSELRKELEKDYVIQVHHCFLPRKIVEEKGLSTAIVDAMDEMFEGLKVFSPNTQFDTYEEVLTHLTESRRTVSEMVDKVYILDSKESKSVTEEIRFISEGKINMIIEEHQ